MSAAGKPGYWKSAIGWIPTDWELLTLSNVAEINPKRIKPADENAMVTFLAMADISEHGSILERQSRSYQEVSKGFTAFAENDVLVAKITPCFENGKRAIATGLIGGIGYGSTEFHVVRAKQGKSIPAFINLHICSALFRQEGEKNMVGSAGQKRVPADFIRQYRIAVPTLLEQEKIAAILSTVDDMLGVIARQIAATQRLKQGLMQKLFSHGVGTRDIHGKWMPHIAFKTTKIGKLPTNWSVEKLDSQVKKIGSGITPKGGSTSYLKDGIPLIRSQNVLIGKLSLHDVVFISQQQHLQMHNSALEPKDVLLNITGASIGRCATLPVNFMAGNVNQHVCILRTLPSLDPNYLCCYLNSKAGQKQVKKFQAGGNREGLNYQQIRSFDIPLPHLIEQQRIAEILGNVDLKLDVLATKQTHYQNLKRGLMQKLLTGEWRVKVDKDALAA